MTLLLQRCSPFTFWQSVTGSLKWGSESPVQAAVRELAEETGIEVSESEIFDFDRRFRFAILPTVRHRYASGVHMNTEHVFALQLPRCSTIQIQESEHLACQWIDFETAIDLVWSWSNREALIMTKRQFLQ